MPRKAGMAAPRHCPLRPWVAGRTGCLAHLEHLSRALAVAGGDDGRVHVQEAVLLHMRKGCSKATQLPKWSMTQIAALSSSSNNGRYSRASGGPQFTVSSQPPNHAGTLPRLCARAPRQLLPRPHPASGSMSLASPLLLPVLAVCRFQIPAAPLRTWKKRCVAKARALRMRATAPMVLVRGRRCIFSRRNS